MFTLHIYLFSIPAIRFSHRDTQQNRRPWRSPSPSRDLPGGVLDCAGVARRRVSPGATYLIAPLGASCPRSQKENSYQSHWFSNPPPETAGA